MFLGYVFFLSLCTLALVVFKILQGVCELSFIIHLCFLSSSSVIYSELSKYYVAIILCAFNWKLNKQLFSVIVSYLLCCLHVMHIILCTLPSWFTKTDSFLKWEWDLDQCHYNSARLLPLYTPYEMEKCPSTMCVGWIYDDCLR